MISASFGGSGTRGRQCRFSWCVAGPKVHGYCRFSVAAGFSLRCATASGAHDMKGETPHRNHVKAYIASGIYAQNIPVLMVMLR
jgi:hypothetical protein